MSTTSVKPIKPITPINSIIHVESINIVDVRAYNIHNYEGPTPFLVHEGVYPAEWVPATPHPHHPRKFMSFPALYGSSLVR